MFVVDGRYEIPGCGLYDVSIKNGTITISSIARTESSKEPTMELDLFKNLRTNEIYFIKDGKNIELNELKYIEPYQINFPYNICDIDTDTKCGTIVPIDITGEDVTFRLWFDEDFMLDHDFNFKYMDLTYKKEKVERKNVLEFFDVYFELCYTM